MADRLHVAVIMDGNGRWATARGLPRIAGHRRGAVTVERIVEAAARLEVGTLTLYAFSADNWRRPAEEIAALMRLFDRYLQQQIPRCRRTRRFASAWSAGATGCRARSAARAETARARDQRRRRAPPAAGHRLLGAGGDPGSPPNARARDGPLARDVRARRSQRPRRPGRRARRRSADPHRRRAAPERLPAVGVRLRGAVVHGHEVAGIRRRGVREGDRRLQEQRPEIRRPVVSSPS